MCNVSVKLNNELNGIELYFEGKPSQEVREEMKLNGYRWNGKKVCWYAKQNKKSIALSEKLRGSEVVEVAPVVKKSNKIDLYELTCFDETIKNDSTLHTKDIAKEVRSYLKKRFPFVKFSIRTRSTGYSYSIDCDIMSSPFEEKSVYLKAIQDYCVKYINTYNYDNSDIMTDYFDVNFYGGYFQTSYKYEQTEATEELKEAMNNYDAKMIEVAEAKRIQEEKEYKEYLIKIEEEKKQAEIREQQIKTDKEYIRENVEVIEIEENNQYYVKNAQFANLNKNNTLDQYKEEIEKGDYYYNTLKVTREVHFKDSKSFNLYSNMLLHDFDFVDGTGGSYTEDLRINSMTDYYNMIEEEKKGVEWLLKGVAVYLDNEIMFVIDAQGYCYARYVGLIGENTTTTKEYNCKQVVTPEEIEERKIEAEEVKEVYNNVIGKNSFNNWYDTRKAIATAIKENVLLSFDKEVIQQVQEEKIKCDLYKVLKEVDTIQDQFNDLALKKGDKLTIVRGSIIGGASISHITLEGYTAEEYAQYKDNIKVIMKVKGKKGLYSTNLYDNDILIYNEWIDLPWNVLYEDTSNDNSNGYATRYGSYDKQALEDVISYYQEKNILPIVNTYKPIF